MNKSPQFSRRMIVILVSLLILLIGAGLWLVTSKQAPVPSSGGSGQALVGGPFTLTGHDGRKVSDTDFRGRYMLVFFGFTYCPDVCPMELQTMSDALDRLPDGTLNRIQPLFITVDPDRDTVDVMADFMAHFHPAILGLTGTDAEIQDAKRAYRVFSQKTGDTDTDTYLVDHSAITFLMGPDGEYVAHFSPGVTPEGMAGRLSDLVK